MQLGSEILDAVLHCRSSATLSLVSFSYYDVVHRAPQKFGKLTSSESEKENRGKSQKAPVSFVHHAFSVD